jgi:membrane-associated PAP2 superfamily phosphatase
MNRTGLAIVLVVAAVTGLTFALYPELDLAIARPFYDPARQTFPLVAHPVLRVLRDAAMWVIALLVAPAVIALVVKLAWPFARMLVPGRAAVFLVVTLILGPGLLVNLTLKEHWPRSRPIDVPQFNGSERFVPWWDPRGACPRNCSFVGGESAGAFWTLAPAAVTPLPLRPFAYAAAVAFGAGVGVMRIVFGGHFFTDVVFAGVLIFLVTWLVHGVLYRWRPTRIADSTVERALERLSLPIWRAASNIVARTRRAPK